MSGLRPYACNECGAPVGADATDMDGFVAALADHGRTVHQWPYPDVAIRNFAYAAQRVDGPTQRLPEIGAVEVHRVTDDRIADWQQFFDREVFADNFAWASCYCSEPHCLDPEQIEETAGRTWEDNRSTMQELLADGRSTGYLAYVDGHPAGWVNASLRSEYALYRRGAGADPADDDVIGIACFAIAPPYRHHGLAARLLDAVLDDAPRRGAHWIEAYPFTQEGRRQTMADFRGAATMFTTRGFEVVEQRERDLVVRRAV